MEKRIVVITSDYLYTFVSEAYKEINLDCEVEIVKYDNFKNIANIYNHYKDSALGFIVSGQMAPSISFRSQRSIICLLIFSSIAVRSDKELLSTHSSRVLRINGRFRPFMKKSMLALS